MVLKFLIIALMTFAQMHTLLDDKLDKSGSPYFSPRMKDEFLTLAAMEWVKNKAPLFETNEKLRNKLLPLSRKFSQSTAGSVIVLDTITDFFYLTRLAGVFELVCGKQSRERKIKVEPKRLNEQETVFSKPDNEFPVYIEYNNGTNNIAEVHSDTPPKSMELFYLKKPVAVDAVNNPAGKMDIPETEHEEVVDIALRKLLLTIEDYRKHQVQTQVELPSNQ